MSIAIGTLCDYNIIQKYNFRKDKNHISGIYKIINIINGIYYIGRSKNIFRRLYDHITDLKNNKHINDYLQNAWNKYGYINFNFLILENSTQDPLLKDNNILQKLEQDYLDIAFGEENLCYNLNLQANGGEISEYSRQKISNKLKGKPKSLEHKLQLSIANKGLRKGIPLTEKTKQKLSLSKIGVLPWIKGKKHKPETIEKMRKRHRGKKLSQEHIKNLARAKISSTVYHFYNEMLDLHKIYRQYDLRKEFNLNAHSLSQLCNGKKEIYDGWKIIEKINIPEDPIKKTQTYILIEKLEKYIEMILSKNKEDFDPFKVIIEIYHRIIDIKRKFKAGE